MTTEWYNLPENMIHRRGRMCFQSPILLKGRGTIDQSQVSSANTWPWNRWLHQKLSLFDNIKH